MSEPFLGEIRLLPYQFAPRNWLVCNGQTIAIRQLPALFAILGTTFGGNGTTTFGVPNLQGLLPVGTGQGMGLSNYLLGQQTGATTVQLTSSQMAGHNHNFQAVAGRATTNTAANSLLAEGSYTAGSGRGTVPAYATQTPDTPLQSSVQTLGGNAAHNNMMPYLALQFCIATAGIFPQRS